ncbi:hypothetical protein [Aquabacterium humicola]|uniref:hypothetical protein n=1 Tax=Aquabacterium humicola TaxID=3237377 RepID=UPI002542CE29|nr:hypothetical protein [Rubrivivax pictus]
MIRAADLMMSPLAGTGLRPAPTLRDTSNETLNPSSWFDGDGLSAATRIGVELAPASRGLSITQHAERVLSHLLGDAAD